MYRIQKIMSMLGLTSRRNAEKLISTKKIRVNGKIAKPVRRYLLMIF